MNEHTQSVSGEPTAAPEISVVAPCFNEEPVIEAFHQRVRTVLEELGRPYEIVVVDDGSRDGTWAKMAALAAADAHLVAVKLSRNYGHQPALTAGLQLARGARVLIIDADLQDPPELLGEMMRQMDQGADVVYGRRRVRHGETAFKKTTASMFYRVLNYFADVHVPEETGDFRLMTRRALDAFLALPERHRFIRGMVSWIGFRQEPILYDREPRHAGQTKYPFRKMLHLAFDAVTSFSTKPLRLAAVMAAVSAIVGLALLIYVLASLLVHRTVSGWASILSAVAILGSMQLLVLSIQGMYLGRIFEEAKRRPLYFIEIVLGRDNPPTP